MDNGRQAAFGMIEGCEQAMHTIERQINDLGVQGHHAFEDGIRPLLQG
jgi:hypothetical protein